MTRSVKSTPGTLPEFLVSPDLGELIAAWIAEQVDRAEDDAKQANMGRVLAAQFAAIRNAGTQITLYHASTSTQP